MNAFDVIEFTKRFDFTMQAFAGALIAGYLRGQGTDLRVAIREASTIVDANFSDLSDNSPKES